MIHRYAVTPSIWNESAGHRFTCTPGAPFYRQLRHALDEAEFDRVVEAFCAPYCGHAPEVRQRATPLYFRTLLVGYFEAALSLGKICASCQDCPAIREFLGWSPRREMPRSLHCARLGLPSVVCELVFQFALRLVERKVLMLSPDADPPGCRPTGPDQPSAHWRSYLEQVATRGLADEPDPVAQLAEHRIHGDADPAVPLPSAEIVAVLAPEAGTGQGRAVLGAAAAEAPMTSGFWGRTSRAAWISLFGGWMAEA